MGSRCCTNNFTYYNIWLVDRLWGMRIIKCNIYSKLVRNELVFIMHRTLMHGNDKHCGAEEQRRIFGCTMSQTVLSLSPTNSPTWYRSNRCLEFLIANVYKYALISMRWTMQRDPCAISYANIPVGQTANFTCLLHCPARCRVRGPSNPEELSKSTAGQCSTILHLEIVLNWAYWRYLYYFRTIMDLIWQIVGRNQKRRIFWWIKR